MGDLSDKGSEYEEMMSKSPSPDSGSYSSDGSGQVKTCADCGTTKTPLWRGGPAGPKSLCNACGIRSRKKRRALLGLNKDDKKPKKATTSSGAATTATAAATVTTTTTTAAAITTTSPNQSIGTRNDKNELGDSLKRKLMALGREVVMQRPRSTLTKQRRKLGEEEQAAILLMALSCGSVYA